MSLAKPIDSQQIIGQYDATPYPHIPLEALPLGLAYVDEWFQCSLVNAFYVRTHQVISTEGTTLLNVGCGSGWETLIMAEANPGADQIVGVDLSSKSVKVAEQRLQAHGYTNVECYALDLLEIEQLNLKFDFITCQDVLYLLDSQVDGLKALRSVLKPEGIICSSLHCYYNRRPLLEAQEVFRLLGLFDLPQAEALQRVREFMSKLKPKFQKRFMWDPKLTSNDQYVLNNHFFAGDKGFTIPQVMTFLREAGLGLVSLVDQPTWTLERQFTRIPDFVQEKLETLSQVELWHLAELLNPSMRLIQFWAEHAGSSLVFPWTEADWQLGSIQFNPVLTAQPDFQSQFERRLAAQQPFEISWLGTDTHKLSIPADRLAWLYPLFKGPVPVSEMMDQAVALDSQANPVEIRDQLLTFLQALEEFLVIFLVFPSGLVD